MKRSKFNLSNYKLFSCDMGELIPCGVMEVVPGDTFQMSTSMLVRAATLNAPVMHPVHARVHHWFVPYRLIWEDFEDFITGGPAGTSLPVRPYTTSSVTVGSLWDYLGVPPVATGVTFSALPHRAYGLIWNEFYRDQDLEAELTISKTSGADASSVPLQNCAWEKDYFTTARPWEQKGPTITIPLGNAAAVKTQSASSVTGIQTPVRFRSAATGALPAASNSAGLSSAGDLYQSGTALATGGANSVYPENLYADLSTASSITANALRQAMALQRWAENRARFGSRYTEYLRASFGVTSSDARLQRPEYLGGGKQTLQFSEVLQTGPEAGGTGVGKMRGHGIGAMRSRRFRRFFEEFGLIISLFSAKPRTMYASGLPRMWSKTTREEFFQPELAHIGQQKVLNKEVYVGHSAPDGTFGWQDRYDEYRRQESTIAGDFRTTLDFWHMARIFTTDPALNAAFVKCVPTERTFAVPSEDVLYVMANHSVRARRCIPAVGSSFIS